VSVTRTIRPSYFSSDTVNSGTYMDKFFHNLFKFKWSQDWVQVPPAQWCNWPYSL